MPPSSGTTVSTLGTVRYIVVRPHEMAVTHIVVHTGVLLGRDVVVPVMVVQNVVADAVQLSITKADLTKYPDYVEGDEGAPAEAHVNVPPGTISIRAGMDVESSDGRKVGAIDAVDLDVRNAEIKGVIVKRGFLLTRDTHIPVGDIETIGDDKIILTLTKQQVQQICEEQT